MFVAMLPPLFGHKKTSGDDRTPQTGWFDPVTNGLDLFIKQLNFRTRLSESIYLFFNNKLRYFAMQVATVPHKLGVDL